MPMRESTRIWFSPAAVVKWGSLLVALLSAALAASLQAGPSVLTAGVGCPLAAVLGTLYGGRPTPEKRSVLWAMIGGAVGLLLSLCVILAPRNGPGPPPSPWFPTSWISSSSVLPCFAGLCSLERSSGIANAA